MKRNFKDYFSRDRKTLYMILSIVMISILTLTVVYAALSTTLNISGNAEVSAANWDIYLDNVQLNSNSATTNVPTISNKTTASFSTTLSKPGDFYEFTIDVVNNGSIDAMIDGITKTPDLSDNQKKYLNYIVEYQNGEAINTKQLVSKNSYVRLKVKIEYRKDISSNDLPITSETLNLAFTVNYIQSDESGIGVVDNGVKKAYSVVSGDLETVGSEIAIGDEHFYIISSDEDSITILAKYNLYVGGFYDGSTWTAYGEEATGIQDSTMFGYGSGQSVRNGTTPFSSSEYWGNVSSGTYVYDINSIIYNYVENYKVYLESKGAEIEEARLIAHDELISLGCSRVTYSCSEAPAWVYGISYWSGSAYDDEYVLCVSYNGSYVSDLYFNDKELGVRPVIILNL